MDTKNDESLTVDTRNASLPPHLRVRALVLDVDGVLTGGGLAIAGHDETKTFDSHDEHAIRLFRRAGGKVAFLSGRRAQATVRFAEELEIDASAMGVKYKLPELLRICEEIGVPLCDTCYMGDDHVDLPCMRAAGLSIAPASAAEPVRKAAYCVTRRPGGQGAVREVIEWLLKSQGKWASVMERYEKDASSS